MLLERVLCEVWSSADRFASAEEVVLALSDADKDRLFSAYERLIKGVPGDASALGSGSPDVTSGASAVVLKKAALLFAFGMGPADTLSYLPARLMAAQLKDVAEEIGVAAELVRFVAVLGRAGMAERLSRTD